MKDFRQLVSVGIAGVMLAGAASGTTSALAREGQAANVVMGSCVATQVIVSGNWSFTYPAKGTVGGRVTAKAELLLTNNKKDSCKFDRSWPKVRLLDKNGMRLAVHEQETDGMDAVGIPQLLPRGSAGGEVIAFQWVNWCASAPELPVQVMIQLVPRGGSVLYTPGLGQNRHFHLPGCVNPTAKSTLRVKPYLAVALPSH